MAIRWSARQVAEALDEIARLLNEVEPIFKQLEAKANETAKLPNLAGYIAEPLLGFANEVKDRLEKYRHRIKTIRGYIPKKDLAEEQNKPKMF